MTIAIIAWVMFWFYITFCGMFQKISKFKLTNGDFYVGWICAWVAHGWVPALTVYYCIKYL
ncbi:Uncharacterised protein [Serratia quinivorans]|nr:Uncharacterised protein [Serratia quinivorans]